MCRWKRFNSHWKTEGFPNEVRQFLRQQGSMQASAGGWRGGSRMSIWGEFWLERS